MERKKTNAFIAIIILCIGISMFLVLFIYSYIINSQYERYFNASKFSQGRDLLNEVMEIDFENDDLTDEEVIDVNNKVIMLIYGDMLAGDEMLDEIIKIQRNLFSNKLLELNNFDNQYENIRQDIKDLRNEDAYTIVMDRGKMKYYYDDNEKASTEVTQYMSNKELIFWEYFLVKEDGKWKINTWTLGDS